MFLSIFLAFRKVKELTKKSLKLYYFTYLYMTIVWFSNRIIANKFSEINFCEPKIHHMTNCKPNNIP